jgi:threonine/homoserine/homoserine lactone efflux protein
MNAPSLTIFAGALLIAGFSPGPAVAALVAHVIGRGLPGAALLVAGLMFGDLVWLAAAILGLAVLAQAFHEVFLVIKYVGAAYLLYLAYRMWTTRAGGADDRTCSNDGGMRLFFAGLAITLGNPKVVAFYLALLPNLIDLRQVGLAGYAELAAICVVVLTLVFGTYGLAAAYARTLLRNARAARLLNRAGGAMMAGAAVTVASR